MIWQKLFSSNEIFRTKKTTPLADMSFNIIVYYFNDQWSYAKFQNNSFVRYISFEQNKIFLPLESLPDDFSKFLFYQVNHGTFFCVEIHDSWPNSLGREQLQRNHRSGHSALLAMLNKIAIAWINLYNLKNFLDVIFFYNFQTNTFHPCKFYSFLFSPI